MTRSGVRCTVALRGSGMKVLADGGNRSWEHVYSYVHNIKQYPGQGFTSKTGKYYGYGDTALEAILEATIARACKKCLDKKRTKR